MSPQPEHHKKNPRQPRRLRQPKHALARLVGCPSTYSQDLADRICDLIFVGYSLHAVCEMSRMPGRTTVFRWLRQFQEFRSNYDMAQREKTRLYAEETIEIADAAMPQIHVDAEGKETIRTWSLDKARMRIAARQWYAARTNPEQFSDKFSREHSGGQEPWRTSVSLADFMTDEELATQRAILEAAEQRMLAGAKPETLRTGAEVQR